MSMSRFCGGIAVSVLLLSCCVGNASADIEGVDNVITQWNAVAQKIVRTLGLPNQISARTYLFLHLSQYKALQVAYQRGFSHPEAAASYAAHYVLSELYPAQQSPIFDGVIASQLGPLNLSATDDAEAQQIAFQFVVQFVRDRASDGSQRWYNFQPAPVGSVGRYQFTPNQTFALYPQLGQTQPVVIKSPSDFDTFGGPPQIPSSEYDVNYNVSASLGNANSPLQTDFHRDTAKFWEDGSNTSGIVGHLFNVSLAVTGTNISLQSTSKLFAKLAVAHYDGSIAGWFMKYEYLFWRPISALSEGDPTHAPDTNFTTVLKTPPHPEYPSTHSVNAGAWNAVLARFLGRNISDSAPLGLFQVVTEGYLLPPRSYAALDELAGEIALSRVYGGVHFLKASEVGVQLGIDIGNYVSDNFEAIFGDL